MEVRSVFARQYSSLRPSDRRRHPLPPHRFRRSRCGGTTVDAARRRGGREPASRRAGKRGRNDHRHRTASGGRFAGRADPDRHAQRRRARQGGTVPLRGSEPAFPEHQHPVRKSAPDQHRGARPRQQPGQRRARIERRRVSRRRLPRPARHGEPGSHRHRADLVAARPARHAVRQEHDRRRAEHRQPRTDVHTGSATGIVRSGSMATTTTTSCAARSPGRSSKISSPDGCRLRKRSATASSTTSPTVNTLNGTERKGTRGDLLYTPTESLKIRLIGGLQHRGFGLLRVGALQPRPERRRGVLRASRGRRRNRRARRRLQQGHAEHEAAHEGAAGRRIREGRLGHRRLHGDVDHRVSRLEFLADERCRRYLRDRPIINAGQHVDDSQWSQELRLASASGGAIDWVTGLYYFYQDQNNLSYTYYGPDAGAFLGHADSQQRHGDLASGSEHRQLLGLRAGHVACDRSTRPDGRHPADVRAQDRERRSGSGYWNPGHRRGVSRRMKRATSTSATRDRPDWSASATS